MIVSSVNKWLIVGHEECHEERYQRIRETMIDYKFEEGTRK